MNRFVPKYSQQIFQKPKSKYAIFIFVLNEGKRIIDQINKWSNYLSSYDLYIVDGGSIDNSNEKLDFYKSNTSGILIKEEDGGLSYQMLIAFDFGLLNSYNGFIFIDGNNKDDCSAIPNFVNLLESGYDHIQGSRFVKHGKAINTPLLRYWGVKLLHAPLISLASKFKYTDTTNGFRGYSSRFINSNKLNIFRAEFKFYELHYYLAIQAGIKNFRVIETPVTREYPLVGKVPTKIKGIKGNILILKTLMLCVFGYYNLRD